MKGVYLESPRSRRLAADHPSTSTMTSSTKPILCMHVRMMGSNRDLKQYTLPHSQAFYQLFWMFVCLYALPIAIPSYTITSFDTFYNNPSLGNTLQAQFNFNSSDVVVGNVTQVGYNTSAYIANIMSYCGFPAGKDFVFNSSNQCWLYRDIWANVSPSQLVPADMMLAVCGPGSTVACPFHSQVSSARGFLSNMLTTTVNNDYKRPLSVLFNAFIMCQVSH